MLPPNVDECFDPKIEEAVEGVLDPNIEALVEEVFAPKIELVVEDGEVVPKILPPKNV